MPRKPRPKADHVVKEIGRRIARFRRDRGVTQVQLAAHLGLSQTNVSSYERGVLRVPSDHLLRIAQVLKASSDELLGLTEAKAPVVDGRRLRHRLEILERLPKRDQDAVSRFLDAFISKLPATLGEEDESNVA